MRRRGYARYVRGYANAHGVLVGDLHWFAGVNVKRLRPGRIRVEVAAASRRTTLTCRLIFSDPRRA